MSIVKVGMIGAGAISHEHCAAINQLPNAQLVAIAEPNDQRRAEFARLFHVSRQYASAEELLADRDIDAVSIAIPNKFHAATAIMALNAGKHVLLEKPLARNADEARTVAHAADRSGKIFMVGLNYRYLHQSQTIREMVRLGRLGEIYHVKTSWMRRAGIPKLGTWFSCREMSGGGSLLDIGIHMLDLALFLMDDFKVASVSGAVYTRFGQRGMGEGDWGRSDPRDQPFDVEDFATAMLRMESGTTITLDATWAGHQQAQIRQQTELFGSDAGACVFPTAQLFTTDPISNDHLTIEPRSASLQVPACSRFANWIDAIQGTAPPICTIHQVLAVQQTLDAIYQSARQGKEVRITPRER